MTRDRSIFVICVIASGIAAAYGYWSALVLLAVGFGIMFIYEFTAALISIRRERRRDDG